MEKTNAKITPLWIVAAFVSLTETVLGYALTKVNGGVQVALTVFVVAFALIVAGAFFMILWHRPYVFYPPSEYGGMDPKAFVEAIRVPPVVEQQMKLVDSVKEDPSSVEAQFKLIDSMLDDSNRQFLILMDEFGCELPYSDWALFGPSYIMENKRHAAHGSFSARDFFAKLGGTGFLEFTREQPSLRLTPSGKSFSKWLVKNGRKADFMFTSFGDWGVPKPNGMAAGVAKDLLQPDSKQAQFYDDVMKAKLLAAFPSLAAGDSSDS